MYYQFTCEVVNKFKDSQKINIDRLMGLKILCSHKKSCYKSTPFGRQSKSHTHTHTSIEVAITKPAIAAVSLSHSLTLLPPHLDIATSAVNLLLVFDSELDHKRLTLI